MSHEVKTVSVAALGFLIASCKPHQESVDPAAVAAEEMAVEARVFLTWSETEITVMNKGAALA